MPAISASRCHHDRRRGGRTCGGGRETGPGPPWRPDRGGTEQIGRRIVDTERDRRRGDDEDEEHAEPRVTAVQCGDRGRDRGDTDDGRDLVDVGDPGRGGDRDDTIRQHG
jgi:hypothetical protein